jgi:alpha(1,3/1,4) fucosyltransferase
MKPLIRIGFSGVWPNADMLNYFFYKLLQERFNVRICSPPDFLFYTHTDYEHRLFNCVKIFYTHETIRPNFNECDYAFTTYSIDDPRHMRLPYYVYEYGTPERLIRQPNDWDASLARRDKFCSFLTSSHHPRKNRNRASIFANLSTYKRVDSGGRFMNNIGGPLPGWFEGKIDWMRGYKFHLAYENASVPGYTTEKLVQAMIARTLPIYWGNPEVHRDFNPKSFIYANEFPSEEALIEKIKEVDQDDAKYLEYISQPYFINNQPNEWFDHNRLLDQFERIFAHSGPSITEQRRKNRFFSFGRWILVKRHHLRK